jgi:hypothetical protein
MLRVSSPSSRSPPGYKNGNRNICFLNAVLQVGEAQSARVSVECAAPLLQL